MWKPNNSSDKVIGFSFCFVFVFVFDLKKYSLCYIVDILLQSVPLPSINSLRLLDFTFDDEAVGDQDTLLGTLAMVMDLKLHEHFNVEYQVCRIKCAL